MRSYFGALVFYAVFTAIYGLGHWAIYLQAKALIEPGPAGRFALMVFLSLMVIGPAAHGLAGRQTAWTAAVVYLWMGLAFYLLLASFIIFGVRSLGLERLARPLGLGLLLAAVVLTSYGLLAARSPKVVYVPIRTDKLPAGVDRLEIAVLSDLHLYSVEAEARLERVLKAMKRLRYDLLVSAGDIVDAGMSRKGWQALAEQMNSLNPPLGKYAVMGNHEYFAERFDGPGIAEAFLKAAGFKVLRQELIKIDGLIQLVGLDDPQFSRGSKTSSHSEPHLLSRADPDLFVLLLKHQPLVEASSLGRFDLQLSGHTHGGQLWPWSLLVRLIYSGYVKGLYDLGSGSLLYVTPGAGTWGPPVRIGPGAEITLIRLVRGDDRG